MIIGIILNFLLSLWIIPKYLGENRKIGFTNSAILCVFLTPFIGGIITLLSPKIHSENNSEEEDYLKNLKNKGLIDGTEFEEKMDKIDNIKIEEILKKSDEYSQLNKLHNSGILTKEEFNNKVEFLRNNFSKFKPELQYNITFIDSHHSFTFGNFKTYNIKWENGFEQKFYVKNSNKIHFLEPKKETRIFENEKDFLKYSYELATK